MGKDVMVALDFPSGEKALAFLDLFAKEERKPYVKVGMELFYSEGPEIVRKIKERGHQIFLDLKLHDIPNTVKGGMRSLRDLGVDMTNLHASGGVEMMRQALRGLSFEEGEKEACACHAEEESSSSEKRKNRPLLIAVTQLTSTDQRCMEEELLIKEELKKVVLHYGQNAKTAGLDGVVCSPWEAREIHEKLGKDFLTITPGVRFKGGDIGDQKRVMSPADAKDAGSDYIVMGRPITQAENPVEAYREAVRQFCD